MGLSFQRYLVAADDTLYRMANTAFDRMLQEPEKHRMPLFAGQRVRTAEVVVEVVERQAIRVVRTALSILTFDAEGRVDPNKLNQQQFARAELVLSLAPTTPDPAETVVDATRRFLAQGGSWSPSVALARVIDDAALGRRKCPRL